MHETYFLTNLSDFLLLICLLVPAKNLGGNYFFLSYRGRRAGWVDGRGRDRRRGEERDGHVGGWHFLLGYHCLSQAIPPPKPALSSGGIWDILSQTTAPWHVEYLLKLKEFEKTETGRSLRPLLPGPLSLSQSEDPHVLPCDRCPPCARREGASLSLKTKGAKKDPNKQAFAESSSRHPTPHRVYHTDLNVSFFPP